MRDPFQGYDQWKTASPYDEDFPCEKCGKHVDDCECPVCPRCTAIGEPRCYTESGPFGGCGHVLANIEACDVAKWMD